MKLLLLGLWIQIQSVGIVTGKVVSPTGMPAAGIRVYAMSIRDAKEAGTATIFESLTQTDEMGRYRLEVPPGRYYIAAGSVEAPTYAPGTTDIGMARVLTIAAGSAVDGVDFSRFVPANRSAAGIGMPAALPPGSTGVLSGIIRYPDGSPIVGQLVVASPTNGAAGPLQVMMSFNPQNAGTVAPPAFTTVMITIRSSAQTDSTGRYRISNVTPGTYYIVSGYADSPSFYPGTSDVTKAAVITTTPTTSLNNLDFAVPPPAPGVSIRGRVTAAQGMPAAGGIVVARNAAAAAPGAPPFYLPGRPEQQSTVKPDGTFEILNVPPGARTLEARLSGTSPVTRNVVVGDQPLNDIDFSFPVVVLTGRILLEDGGGFPDPQALGQAAVSTAGNPNFVATTFIDIDKNGTFTRIIEKNAYRFFFRVLPNDYVIKSITDGYSDLVNETLKIRPESAPAITVRLAKRMEADNAEPKVRGRVIDSAGGTSTAEQIQLCCLESGPFEKLSTRVQPDGSFEFMGVPPGHYTAGVQGRSNLSLVDSNIDVGSDGASGITLLSTPKSVAFTLMTTVDGASPPPGFRALVSFTGVSGLARVTAEAKDRITTVALPSNDQYVVTVTNVPAEYAVKSAKTRSGGADLLTDKLVFSGQSILDIIVAFERRQR